jgi:tetratricopeptide (TPR) repeat protein
MPEPGQDPTNPDDRPPRPPGPETVALPAQDTPRADRTECEGSAPADDDGSIRTHDLLNPGPVAAGPDGLRPKVPGYEVLSEIGRGGMGVVYKARHLQLNRVVALKMILAGLQAGPATRKRFQAEAELVARLQHPGVVQIHEVGEYEGRPFFALEYVDGGTLADRLDGTPLPAADAARLIADLAETLHHAHQRGVLHRDLKPANVLIVASDLTSGDLTPPAEPQAAFTSKVTDFGLAKLLDTSADPSQTGSILGTPSYMPPEQAEGRTDAYGPTLDVYSLGAILYECLTGRPPFKAATPLDTVLQVIHDDPVPVRRLQPKVPHDLETVCLKCLEKEPERRYPTAQELADDLRRFLAGEPVLARPVGALGRGLRWARRNPRVAGLLALLAAVVVGGFTIVAWEYRQARQQQEIAERQRLRAQANLQAAIDAVDRMFTRVSEGPLEFVPQLEDERRRLLEDAVAFYDSLLQSEADDPALRRETGRACARAARLHQKLGQTARAEQLCDRGVGLLEALAAEYPNQPAYRFDLGEALLTRAALDQFLGRHGLAEEALGNALRLGEQLEREQPGTPEYRELLAQAHGQRGLLYYSTLRRDDAERELRQAADEAGRLAADHPGNLSYRTGAANADAQLGFFLVNIRRVREAIPPLRRAVEQLEQLERDHPAEHRRLEADLARARMFLGYALALGGRSPTQANAMLQEAVTVLRRLVVDYPRSHPYRYTLAIGLFAQARIDQSAGHPAAAEPRLRQALDLVARLTEEQPDVEHYSLLARQCRFALGQALQSLDRPGDAQRLMTEAITVARGQVRQQPQVSLHADELVTYLIARSELLARLDHHAESQRDLDEAMSVLDGPLGETPGTDDPRMLVRVMRACAVVRGGDYRTGLAEAERAVADAGKNLPGAVAYHLACADALASVAVRNDESLPPDERAERSREFAERAVQRLESAFKFLNEAAMYPALKTERDLLPLRDRPDFRQFLDRLNSRRPTAPPVPFLVPLP